MTAFAWGQRVSTEFRVRVARMADRLGLDPSWLMAVMAFETGRTFSPSVKNPGSSATGLIQFMDATARELNTTTTALAAMSAVEQLDYVERYLTRYKGRMRTLSDVYMAVLWPAGIGKDENAVIFHPGSKQYLANLGLDIDHDGAVTKAEAAQFVTKALAEGLKPENATVPDRYRLPESTQEKTDVDPFSIVGMLASVFSPLIRSKVEQAVGTEVGKPLVDNLLNMAGQLTGEPDPVIAARRAMASPEAVAKLEQAAVDWFAQVQPFVDKIAKMDADVRAATEASRGAARAFTDPEAWKLRWAQATFTQKVLAAVLLVTALLIAVMTVSLIWMPVAAQGTVGNLLGQLVIVFVTTIGLLGATFRDQNGFSFGGTSDGEARAVARSAVESAKPR